MAGGGKGAAIVYLLYVPVAGVIKDFVDGWEWEFWQEKSRGG